MSTEDLIRREAEALAVKLRGGAIARDRNYEAPLEVLEMFASSGLLGRAVSPKYWPALLDVTAELASSDASVAELFAVHAGALAVVAVRALEPLRQRVLAEVAVGGWLGGTLDVGLAGSGRDAFSLRPVAHHDSVLEGPAQLIIGPPSSRWLILGVGDVRPYWTAPVPVLLAELIEPIKGGGEANYAPFGLRGAAHPISRSGALVTVRGRVLEPAADSDDETRLLAFVQALASAAHLGIAKNALDEGVEYVQRHARPWIDANVNTAAEDPLTVRRYGELVSRVHALQEMLLEMQALIASPEDASVALLFALEFHAFARRISVEVASSVIELGGTSAADDRYSFDRHWRNARALTLHTDVRAIDRALGAHKAHDGVWPSFAHPFSGLAQGVRR